MKKVVSVILTAILLAGICLLLTGCDKPKIRVESVIKINEDFKGTRTVTVVYPLKTKIDDIKDDIISDNPASSVEGAEFNYLGATEDGYSFELKLTFKNRREYEKQVHEITGIDASVVLARKDSILFSGTRMKENFDVSNLISWIRRKTENSSATKNYTFDYAYNKVKIGKDSFDTGSTVSINEGKGLPVNSVEVKTYSEKSGLLAQIYDRSFIISIPSDTYSENERKINAYFKDIAGEDTLITDTREGNNVIYTIAFEDMTLAKLELITAEILNSDGVSIYYGDKEKTSTPLYKGCVLEECLDTLSFDSPTGKPPVLKYTYSPPQGAVRGEASIFKNGSWQSVGSWDDGVYRFEDESGMVHLRIFDGRQYYLNGVDFELTALGDNRFKRVTSFLYPLTDYESANYALEFFESKDVQTEWDSDDDHFICSIICEGDLDEVNDELERIFGNGNYLSFERKKDALSDKTTLVDHIDLRRILGTDGDKIEKTYRVSADNGENIVTVTNGRSETAYKDKNASVIEFSGSVADIGYHGVIPKAGNIIFYILFGFLLFGVTTFLAFKMLQPPIRRERAELSRLPQNTDDDVVIHRLPDRDDDTPSYAPTQTTTFSIFELGRLSRNKKYVDEINNDVEKRLHDDRIRKRKKELRRQELAEMEKKVYGTENTPVPEKPEEYHEPRTLEILDTLDEATKEAPPTPEPTDPMELLNLMRENEEDDSDETGGV